MSEFLTHQYSGRAYTAEENVSFSQCKTTHFADIDKEMQFHKSVKHLQISQLTQDEFDYFVKNYADRYKSIYFFQNPKVRDLSALSQLHNVEYLLFYNLSSTKKLWDMSGNTSLKGLFISDSKNMIYDISEIAKAPVLEELLLFSSLERKHIIKTLFPIKNSKTLKRVMLECKTENADFVPDDFSNLEVFNYRVDKYKNYNY